MPCMVMLLLLLVRRDDGLMLASCFVLCCVELVFLSCWSWSAVF